MRFEITLILKVGKKKTLCHLMVYFPIVSIINDIH
jgi:hypothetical protein